MMTKIAQSPIRGGTKQPVPSSPPTYGGVSGVVFPPAERRQVLAALAASGQWVKIYYGWRPNLADEGDNHLFELAVAGDAGAIVTHNIRHLRSGELRWHGLAVLTPAECLESLT
jgi:predicted nucleic acid-binding protein